MMNILNSLKISLAILQGLTFGLNYFKGLRLTHLSIGKCLAVYQMIRLPLIRKFKYLLHWRVIIHPNCKVLLDMQFSIHYTLWMIKIYNFQ